MSVCHDCLNHDVSRAIYFCQILHRHRDGASLILTALLNFHLEVFDYHALFVKRVKVTGSVIYCVYPAYPSCPSCAFCLFCLSCLFYDQLHRALTIQFLL